MFSIDRPTVLPPSTSYRMGSLFVCDLLPEVTEKALFELFQSMGPVFSVKIRQSAESPLKTAYVNFHSFDDAKRAMNKFNLTKVFGHPCRIMWTQKNRSRRETEVGNLIVKNVDPDADHKVLYDAFAVFDDVKSFKMGTNKLGKTLDYAFVQYWDPRSAEKAIAKMNGMIFEGKDICVEHYKRSGFTNIFVKNFPKRTSYDALEEICHRFGEFTSLAIPKFENGMNKGFLFCNYERHEDAVEAIKSLNGMVLEGQMITALPHKKKEERILEKFVDETVEDEKFDRREGFIEMKELIGLDEEDMKYEIGCFVYSLVCDMVPESEVTCQKISRMLMDFDITELLTILESPREVLLSKVSESIRMLYMKGLM